MDIHFKNEQIALLKKEFAHRSFSEGKPIMQIEVDSYEDLSIKVTAMIKIAKNMLLAVESQALTESINWELMHLLELTEKLSDCTAEAETLDKIVSKIH